MESKLSLKLKELMKKKDDIEKLIESLNSVLVSENNVGMTGPLVDSEQFPRNDIDVFNVRQTRQRILCLQTDHKQVMEEIEKNLYALHGETLASKMNESDKMEVDGEEDKSIKADPFISVGRVDPGSPACSGGLKAGDQIIEFGSLNKKNFSSLEDVSRVTRHNKGHPVSLVVLRDGKQLQLTLTPNTWTGPGILGCSILPLQR